jgi:hypothetical protein
LLGMHTRPFARWVALNNEAVRSAKFDLVQAVSDDLVSRVMADVRGRPAHPLGPIQLFLLDDHADYFTRNEVVILAEVICLDLLTPNFFPTFILLPRLHRLGNLYRKARNAWPSRL